MPIISKGIITSECAFKSHHSCFICDWLSSPILCEHYPFLCSHKQCLRSWLTPESVNHILVWHWIDYKFFDETLSNVYEAIIEHTAKDGEYPWDKSGQKLWNARNCLRLIFYWEAFGTLYISTWLNRHIGIGMLWFLRSQEQHWSFAQLEQLSSKFHFGLISMQHLHFSWTSVWMRCLQVGETSSRGVFSTVALDKVPEHPRMIYLSVQWTLLGPGSPMAIPRRQEVLILHHTYCPHWSFGQNRQQITRYYLL